MSAGRWRGYEPSGSLKAALTFSIGALGAWVFHWLSLPLPWLLGAVSASLLASLAHAPVGISGRLRAVLLVVLGIMLGASFTPDVLARAGDWIPTLIGVVAYLAVVTLAAFFYCRKWVKMDRVTAVFSALPGGLSQMVIVGEENGADIRSLTLTHAVRVASVLMVLPLFLTCWRENSAPADLLPPMLWSQRDALIIIGSAAGGVLLGHLARLPAHYLTGPLLVSAAVHLSGLVSTSAPPAISILVQIALGSAIGARFSGISVRELGRLMLLAFGLALMMMGITLIFAALLAAGTGLPFDALVLALAPGGFAEMALAALSMNIDPSFVSTHHGLRLILIVILAPIIISYFVRRARLLQKH